MVEAVLVLVFVAVAAVAVHVSIVVVAVVVALVVVVCCSLSPPPGIFPAHARALSSALRRSEGSAFAVINLAANPQQNARGP